MNAWVTRILVSIVMAGWGTQLIAQTNSTYTESESKLGSLVQSGTEYPVDRATFLKKLLWGLTVSLNSKGQYKLVPLFGYPRSKLSGNEEIDWEKVDAEIKNGNVRLVVLEPKSSGEEDYLGRAIIVVQQDDINVKKSSEQSDPITGSVGTASLSADNVESLLDAETSPDQIFAFTRPLAKIDYEEEFIGGTNLWVPPN